VAFVHQMGEFPARALSAMPRGRGLLPAATAAPLLPGAAAQLGGRPHVYRTPPSNNNLERDWPAWRRGRAGVTGNGLSWESHGFFLRLATRRGVSVPGLRTGVGCIAASNRENNFAPSCDRRGLVGRGSLLLKTAGAILIFEWGKQAGIADACGEFSRYGFIRKQWGGWLPRSAGVT